jgi:hypothetical protein
MKSEVYVRKVDTLDELLPRNFYIAASTQKNVDLLGLKTHDLRTRVAKCIEDDGGILDYLL